MRVALALAAAAALLAACGGEEDPGGLSPEESRELNEAAEMLDTAEPVAGEAALEDETAPSDHEPNDQ